LFSGKLVVLVKATDKTGSIELNVTGDGLESGHLKLNAVR